MAILPQPPWDALYEAAREIVALSPWWSFGDGVFIGMTVPGEAETWYLDVSGCDECEFVVALCPGDAAARALIHAWKAGSDSPSRFVESPHYQVECAVAGGICPKDKDWLRRHGLWASGRPDRQTLVCRAAVWRAAWVLDDPDEAQRLLAPLQTALRLLTWVCEQEEFLPGTEGNWQMLVATSFNDAGVPLWELRAIAPQVPVPVGQADAAAMATVQNLPRKDVTVSLSIRRALRPTMVDSNQATERLGYLGVLTARGEGLRDPVVSVALDDPYSQPLDRQLPPKLCDLLAGKLGCLPATVQVAPESLLCLLQPTLDGLGITGEYSMDVYDRLGEDPDSREAVSAFDYWRDSEGDEQFKRDLAEHSDKVQALLARHHGLIAAVPALTGDDKGQDGLRQLLRRLLMALPFDDGPATFAAVTEDDLRKALIEEVAAEWVGPPARLARLPAGLAEFLEAVRAAGGLPADSGLAETARRLDAEFARRLADPDLWGDEKRAVYEAVANGTLSWNDEAGIEDFLEQYRTDEAGRLADADYGDEDDADDGEEWDGENPYDEDDGEDWEEDFDDEADDGDADDDEGDNDGDGLPEEDAGDLGAGGLATGRGAPDAPLAPYRRGDPRIGRNDPCPCGSGKKYKKCCGA